MKNSLAGFIAIIILFVGCCKQELLPENTIIGEWEILKIDSTRIWDPTTDPWVIIKTYEDRGTISFARDSSGFFNTSLVQINEGEEFFRWMHDTINQTIDMSFDNGTTTAFIEKRKTDTLVFHLRHYLNVDNRAKDNFYGIHLVKKQL